MSPTVFFELIRVYSSVLTNWSVKILHVIVLDSSLDSLLVFMSV